MRIVSGCLKSTPLPWLPTLSHIAPRNIRRQERLVKEYQKIFSNHHLPVHNDLPDTRLRRLKSRSRPLLLAEQLLGENFSINDKWREYWDSLKPDQAAYVIDPTAALPGMELPRNEWKVLNRHMQEKRVISLKPQTPC
ncbi:uncharacterized protein LOC115885710 [Sitophilus oryzae]|uniref:Uncharacterized protein LOC115885710 n=1 Tax=Sitophilus oryzae TaxID=7048 RepID=A0A6J2YBC6_SITOR|nr:uncharacterized protein LOC115885710 [Sitophilus oryzae]